MRSIAFALATLLAAPGLVGAQGWMYYGGDEGGTRYSSLEQVNRDNVGRLEVAWSVRTGAMARHPDLRPVAGFHATPVLLPAEAGGHLVVCTPFNRIIALDPASGAERWHFDAEIDLAPNHGRFNCRGVTPWRDPQAMPGTACAWRIFMGTNDRRLFAVDAASGKPCAGFGEGGQVDVTPLLRADSPRQARMSAAQFVSPPAVVAGTVILGSTNNAKFGDAFAPDGRVRGFDARTGRHRWTFDTLVRTARPGIAAVPKHVGGANAWSMMSVDAELGLVFVPTASPSPDFYGGLRPGDNRYANSIVALRAATGEVAWHFQLVHHDVWDYDVPAQPILAEITRGGERIPVVVQLTKMGMVFVFHRATGEPFFDIEERAVPRGGAFGDQLSPTQPFPVRPPPLVPHGITPADAWGFTFLDRANCRRQIAGADHGGIYTPPSERGMVMYPGPSGGNNWSGGAFDPGRNLLVAPVMRLPFYVRLVANENVDMEAAGNNPMAGMPFGPPGPVRGTGHALEQRPLMSPAMSPCTAPPWAKLVAVDLDAGEIRWSVPIGVLDKLMPLPLPLKFGAPYSGGPIATAGGLVFMAATADERIRAFDIDTGEQLWEAFTPTSSNATPMTYEADGRQFIVVASGGHMFIYPQNISDHLVAYALPRD